MKHTKIGLALVLLLSVCISSCGLQQAESPTQTSSSGVQTMDVSNQFKMPKNAQGNTVEQQQILDKQKVTSDPTKIMWMHLVDLNGRIYLRTPVKGKVTSSSKRLEPVTCVAGWAGDSHINMNAYGAKTPQGELTTELIQIDGTYGQSDPYVYWFDPRGYYYQFGQGYILSDMPIDTKEPIEEQSGLFKVDKLAEEWQNKLDKKTNK